ncbi:MAG: hypothetical protein ACK5OB_01455 [Pirellula sp.]
MANESEVRLCDRCLCQVEEGKGAFFQVAIDAVADPTPPNLDAMEDEDPGVAYRKLLAKLHRLSEREAMEQVHRRRIFSLCNPCLETWLESPFS